MDVKLSAPWEKFARELTAMFDKDPDVIVSPLRDEGDDKRIRVFVTGHDKCNAIGMILPQKQTFGGVTVHISVHESNKVMNTIDLYRQAFSGNEAVSFVEECEVSGGKFNYVVFKPYVVQFFNDNIGNIYGMESMLMEDVARDVFNSESGIFFCTDKIANNDDSEG